MRTFLRLLAVACIIGVSGSIVHAGNGGSIYSRFGIGDIQYFSTSRGMGMGGASVAVLSGNAIDRTNPATWTRINRTRFEASALYEGFSTSDNASSVYLSGTSFNGFMFAIPLLQSRGITFAGGITPFSRINYDLLSPVSEGGYDYNIRYIGNGGISQGHVGFSLIMWDNFSLGAKLNYYFGTLEHIVRQTFASSSLTTGEVLRSTRINGLGGTFGLAYSGFQSLLHLPENKALNIGMTFSMGSNLTTQDERFYQYATSITTRDTVVFPEGTLKIPFALSGGIAFASERWLIAADVRYQQWSHLIIDGVTPAEIRNSTRIGLGGELTPKRDADAPFFQRLNYQFGGYYHSTYYRINDEPINEVGITAGVAIPILSDTRLSIAGEYGFRGTTDHQLQKDKILRISFTLSVGELWFIKTQED